MQSFQKNNKKAGDLTLDKIIDDEIFIYWLLQVSSKQNMNTMQMEYKSLLRVYEAERFKKTFWGAVGAFWK